MLVWMSGPGNVVGVLWQVCYVLNLKPVGCGSISNFAYIKMKLVLLCTRSSARCTRVRPSHSYVGNTRECTFTNILQKVTLKTWTIVILFDVLLEIL